jgi:hypothetical protein
MSNTPLCAGKTLLAKVKHCTIKANFLYGQKIPHIFTTYNMPKDYHIWNQFTKIGTKSGTKSGTDFLSNDLLLKMLNFFTTNSLQKNGGASA